MKTKLKILYKTPDLDALAEKHQDFDGLMDSLLDEKIRRRKKLNRVGSFAVVILATAFLSWLYWGYEPTSTQLETSPVPQTQTPDLITQPEEPELKEDQVVDVVEEQTKPVVEPEEPVKKEAQETEAITTETAATTQKEAVEKPEDEDNEMALPSVTINSVERIDAKPAEGWETWYKYLYSKVDLPDSIIGESGSFYLEVTIGVQENGDISNVKFSKELPEAVAAEMTQIFLNRPDWIPAREGEKPVDSEIKLPITFQKKD